MSSPPTGTVTFLFTDIEGSTKLAQAHPVEWEAAHQRHHAILREATEVHAHADEERDAVRPLLDL
jgi:class 3 adenylate cyclase